MLTIRTVSFIVSLLYLLLSYISCFFFPYLPNVKCFSNRKFILNFLAHLSVHQIPLDRAFPEKNCTAPPLHLLRISIILKLTPWISSQIYPSGVTVNFPFFCIDPLEIHVFSSISGEPPGIQTTFTLPPGIFH